MNEECEMRNGGNDKDEHNQTGEEENNDRED